MVRFAACVLAAGLAVAGVPDAASASSSARHYVVPIAGRVSWSSSHHDYPAADIFPAAGCGAPVIAPTAGRVVQVRRVDRWRAATDNPAWRGGKTVDLLGDDGVRYHLAHLSAIDATVRVGRHVVAGTHLGAVGRTGRAGVCHLHLGLSPFCHRLEWSVRRGVVWPQRFLAAWRAGHDLSPAAAVTSWSSAHPTACSLAAAAPHASEA